MILTYTPADGDPQEYPIDLNKVTSGEAEAIERVTGLTYVEFQDAFIRGSMLARRALLWVMQKRQRPSLKFTDVSFLLSEVEVDFDATERERMADWLRRNPDADEEERAAVLKLLGEDYLENAAAELGESDPKETVTQNNV